MSCQETVAYFSTTLTKPQCVPYFHQKESSKKGFVGIKRLLDDLRVTATQLEDIDKDSAHMVAASKVPMLKPACESVEAFGRNSFTRRCEPEAIKKFVT
ncbi:hypothetical protein Tco_0027478 [Tanacetum coccineum]